MVRRKISCPVCNAPFVDLHMKKAHKWDKIKASTVVSDFGLRKKREVLPDENCRSEGQTHNTYRICNYMGCTKQVCRLRNH